MKSLVVISCWVSLLSASFSAAADEPIPIIRLANEAGPDGSFTYEYETGNGIKAGARTAPRGGPDGAPEQEQPLSVQGYFSYVGDDGQTYSVTYVADENGFQPVGAHLPTPPPIPEGIRRALEYNAAHPEEDDDAGAPETRPTAFRPEMPEAAPPAPFRRQR